MILPIYYTGLPSYIESLGREYFYISLFLSFLAASIIILKPNYNRLLLGQLFSYPVKSFGGKIQQQKILTRLEKGISLLFFCGTVALSIVMLLKPYHKHSLNIKSYMEINNYLLWFALTLILIIIYNIKYINYSIGTWITKDQLNIYKWGNNIFNINYMMSFLLLGLIITYVLGYLTIESFKIGFLSLVFLDFAFRFGTTLSLISRYDFGQKLNFFLYFCTLEILPLLLLGKLVQDQIT